MEKFYPVQIPYRGIVPLINKRGPLASVELQESMIRELQGMGVEMLNPDNGKPFNFPEPVKLAGGMELKPAEDVKPEDKKVEESDSNHDLETSGEETKDNEKAEEPAIEPEKSEDFTDPASVDTDNDDDGEDEEVQIDPNSGAIMMDATKVPGYDALSRNKQKAVRRRFREAYAETKDINIAYAEAAIAVNKKD